MTPQESAIRRLQYLKKFEDKELFISDLMVGACDVAIEALLFQQELVRCKDCANALPWRGDSFYCSVYSYETWKMLVIDDGFCHLGERRDEE